MVPIMGGLQTMILTRCKELDMHQNVGLCRIIVRTVVAPIDRFVPRPLRDAQANLDSNLPRWTGIADRNPAPSGIASGC